jgi:hypothetical protein
MGLMASTYTCAMGTGQNVMELVQLQHLPQALRVRGGIRMAPACRQRPPGFQLVQANSLRRLFFFTAAWVV